MNKKVLGMPLNTINLWLQNNRLAKNILIYGGANGISALAPFVLLPVLTSYLAPSEFGIFAIFLLLVGIFTILCGVNLHGSFSVFYFKLDAEKFRSYVSSGFILVGVNLVVVLLGWWLISKQLSIFLKISSDLVLLAIFVGFINVFFLSCLAIMQASNSPISFLKLKLAQSFVEIVLALYLVALEQSNSPPLWQRQASRVHREMRRSSRD